METQQMRRASFNRRVELRLCRCKIPLRNCPGDDKVLAADDELREPNERNNIHPESCLNCDIMNDLNFSKIAFFQSSWTGDNDGEVQEQSRRHNKRQECPDRLNEKSWYIDERTGSFFEQLNDQPNSMSLVDDVNNVNDCNYSKNYSAKDQIFLIWSTIWRVFSHRREDEKRDRSSNYDKNRYCVESPNDKSCCVAVKNEQNVREDDSSDANWNHRLPWLSQIVEKQRKIVVSQL